MKTLVTIPVFALVASALLAGPTRAADDSLQADEKRYSDCIDLAERAPDKGINMALVWQGQGGGVPARHCEALGLYHMGEYAEAAIRLVKIAEDMRVGKGMPVKGDKRLVADAPMLADMYDQAANAWLMAGETIRAEDAIMLALAVVPTGSAQERELLIDRARVAAADQDFTMALSDLKKVLAEDPGRKDILVLVASAARGVGQYAEASAALQAYMEAFPDEPSAYLELGNLNHALGNIEDARKAWLKVLLITETGPDADAARDNLEKLDLKAEDKPEDKAGE
ncbi:MAG: tetratricopeptide repeat protein [Alphaproteobacteria bacterium]|nr:MAG: tetratricopeptide repeat protein [Alphaproteobacteria bacterium]